MHVLIFEDSRTDLLAPITISRPAYAITCASYRLIDWLRRLDVPLSSQTRRYLQPIEREEFPDLIPVDRCRQQSQTLLAVNARAVPRRETFDALSRLIQRSASGIVTSGDDVAAIVLSGADVAKLPATADQPLWEQMAATPNLTPIDETIELFQWPHDVVRWHMQLMNPAMEDRIASGNYKQLEDGVFVAPGARLGQYASIDTSEGPILLDQNVAVGPFCYLSGPVYAGPNTRVIEHAALKDGVSLGHTVKIGGEVEASIIEPYSNKQHHGFLGHSYLGSWINLGAGTCNSDLKNTYGKINIEYGSQKIPTGMQFLGCIVGDYSKTAINTGIFTGKVIGVCSMLYGFVTQNVPSFVNYAQIFGQVAEIPADVMIAAQARMFARRKVQQRPCDIELIKAMYEMTADARGPHEEIEVY